MKLIYLEWGYTYEKEIEKALIEKEVEIYTYQIPEMSGFEVYSFQEKQQKDALQRIIEQEKPDGIFSINFLAGISDFCQQNGIAYYAWVLQLPNMDLLSTAIYNSCNRVAICDSYLVERLRRQNIENIFFLPDAVAECRWVRGERVRGCSYVGTIPPIYKDTPFGTYSRGLSENTMGYLSGLLQCQRVLYGATMLEDILMGSAATEMMERYLAVDHLIPQFHKLYLAETYLAPEATRQEQIILLQNLGISVNLGAFIDGEFPDCQGQKHAYPQTVQERQDIYGSSIINMVQAHRSYHDAIPHQALEIMASGNFMFSNYQKDYGYFFCQGEDIVCYGDSVERAQLFNQYGQDKQLRERVIEAGFEKVRAGHTYAHRVDFWRTIWEKI